MSLADEFYKYLTKIGVEANQHGIDMVLRVSQPSIMQPGDLECTGFFTNKRLPWYSTPTFSVTLLYRDLQTVFEVLLHEYCHMLQWIEGGIWYEYENFIAPEIRTTEGVEEPWDVINKWLKGSWDKSSEFVMKCIRAAQALEIDCERKTVRLILGENIENINAADYAAKANSYLYFYTYMLIHRFWYTGRRGDCMPPYTHTRLVAAMPTEIYDDDRRYYEIPRELELIYDEIYLSWEGITGEN